MRRFTCLLITALLMTFAHPCFAPSDLPNVKGTRAADEQVVVQDRSPQTAPKKRHSEFQAGPRFTDIGFTRVIDQQEGFRFCAVKSSPTGAGKPLQVSSGLTAKPSAWWMTTACSLVNWLRPTRWNSSPCTLTSTAPLPTEAG